MIEGTVLVGAQQRIVVALAELEGCQTFGDQLFGGPRGGRGLALRAGRATFADALRGFGALAGVGDLAFKVLPLAVVATLCF